MHVLFPELFINKNNTTVMLNIYYEEIFNGTFLAFFQILKVKTFLIHS